MAALDDPIPLTFPRLTVRDVVSLSKSPVDRLHELLERNTDGLLSAAEQEQLETLVRMAHFGQALSSALQPPGQP